MKKKIKLRHTKLSVRIWIVCLLEFWLVNIHSVDWHQHFDRKNYHQFQFASVFIEYLTFISNIMQSYNNNSYNKHGKIRRGERKSKTVIRYNRRKRPSLWRIDGSCFLSMQKWKKKYNIHTHRAIHSYQSMRIRIIYNLLECIALTYVLPW